MLGHERLRVWKMAHELTLALYNVTAHWPTDERFGLTAQIRRAGAALPTNLAEGAAKRGSREFRRFTDVALGSLAEVAYLLLLARDLGLLTAADYTRIDNLRKKTGGLAWRLARALDRPPART
jgi:four helix bundle protein